MSIEPGLELLHGDRASVAEGVFALLLRAYPRRFRAAFGPELMHFFREDRRRAAARGTGGLAGFWLRTLVDLARSALRQRFGSGRHPRRPPAPRKAGSMSSLIFDIRFAVRSLARSPGFFALALVTLVLGIGATTAILSVVDGVMMRSLPYPEADRLVAIGSVFPHDPDGWGPLSEGNLQDLRNLTESLDAVVAGDDVSMTLLGSGDPELVEAAAVTSGFFELFGVPLIAGRALVAADYEEGAPHAAVLAHGFWRARWGGDTGAVGSSITLNGEQYRIVGIASPDFHPPEAVYSFRVAQMFVPWRFDWTGEVERGNFGHQALGKLAAGVTASAAGAEIDALLRRTNSAHSPDMLIGGRVVSLRERTLGSVGEPLRLLLVASAFLLLIACANVANLMLARGTARRREIALRAALGAGRGRIARQFLTESLVLALLAGVLGALAAYWAVGFFKAAGPGGIPRLAEVSVDLRVLGLALLLSTVTGALFGLAPVFQARRADTATELKGAGSAFSGAAGRSRARSALVVAEVALALILLVGAGLLLSSFVRLSRVDAGFSPPGLMSMRLNLRSAYPRDAWPSFYQELLDRVEAIPDVESASLTTSLPFAGIGVMSSLTPEGGATTEETFITSTFVTADHFRTMGIELLEGRDFGSSDREGGPEVAIINQAFMERFWPAAESAVGKRVKMGPLEGEDPLVEVVGLVTSLRYSQNQDAMPEIYFPAAQDGWWRSMTVVARTPGDPAALAPAMRQAVWDIDDSLPIDRVVTVADLAHDAVQEPRFYSFLAASFALVAVALALVGIYGTISYSVGRRAREIGIRVAVGAERRNVLRLVVGSGLRLTVVGVVIGLGGSFALTRLMSRFLFGVSATDMPTFAAAASLFVATSLVACYIPARRAARLDPVRTLRSDA